MGLDMYLTKRDRTGSCEAGYWRKANAIHAWFVEHVQGGNDDCGEYPVSREQLQELLQAVDQVLEACELVDGEVRNGSRLKNGAWTAILERGRVVQHPAVAAEVLPTQSGFFFGSTEYDQYYVEDLQETKRILEAALAAVDGAEFFYQSSW